MKIGIDIDGVIAKFTQSYVACATQLDKIQDDKGFKDKKLFPTEGMFFWTEQQVKANNKICVEKIFDYVRSVKDARMAINKLREDGHKIILISARGFDGYSTRRQTVAWLKNTGFKYDKLITHKKNKLPALKSEKIDFMIEDSINSANYYNENGIKTLLFNDYFNKYKKTNCMRFDNWSQLLDFFIPKNSLSLLPVVIDTDVCNEIDDEFALAYLLKSHLNIEAITIAPNFFLTKDGLDIEANCKKSYKKAKQICSMTRKNLQKNIYIGSTNFMTNGYKDNSIAVQKIIDIARNNEKTLIIAIGAPTNLALAIKKAPEIEKKIKVLFLAGNFVIPENSEYNYSQDLVATNFLLSRNLDLTIFPVMGVTDKLKVNMPYLCEKLDSNIINKLLLKDFDNFLKNHDCEMKSLFDVCPIAYALHPLWFDEEKKNFKLFKTKPVFGKGKYFVKIISNFNEDKVLKDLIHTLNK